MQDMRTTIERRDDGQVVIRKQFRCKQGHWHDYSTMLLGDTDAARRVWVELGEAIGEAKR